MGAGRGRGGRGRPVPRPPATGVGVPVADRAALLTALAAHLRADAERYAALVTTEMGKPLAEARGEVEKSAVTADHYAAHIAGAARAPGRGRLGTPGTRAFVRAEPLGLVLAVMPWNFPVWQVMRFAIPTLAAGNGVLLKHSPNVTGSALALADAFVAAGFPAGLVTALVVPEPDVPDTVARADRRRPHRGGHAHRQQPRRRDGRRGSRAGGEAVGPRARRVRRLRRPRRRGRPCCRGRRRAGALHQRRARAACVPSASSCTSRWREEFTERFVAGVRALVVGDPTDPRTDGRAARPAATCATPSSARSTSRSPLGARLAAGGAVIDGPGSFYEPTVLLDTRPGMPVFDEETFGPVAAIATARRRRRAGRPRRRHAVRARAERLERRHRPRARGGRPPDLRRGLRQRRGRLRPPRAVRWHATQRVRPRARRGGRARVHQPAHLLGQRGERHHRVTAGRRVSGGLPCGHAARHSDSPARRRSTSWSSV